MERLVWAWGCLVATKCWWECKLMISFGEEKEERVHEKGREYASLYSALPLGVVARGMEYSWKEVRLDKNYVVELQGRFVTTYYPSVQTVHFPFHVCWNRMYRIVHISEKLPSSSLGFLPTAYFVDTTAVLRYYYQRDQVHRFKVQGGRYVIGR